MEWLPLFLGSRLLTMTTIRRINPRFCHISSKCSFSRPTLHSRFPVGDSGDWSLYRCVPVCYAGARSESIPALPIVSIRDGNARQSLHSAQYDCAQTFGLRSPTGSDRPQLYSARTRSRVVLGRGRSPSSRDDLPDKIWDVVSEW